MHGDTAGRTHEDVVVRFAFAAADRTVARVSAESVAADN